LIRKDFEAAQMLTSQAISNGLGVSYESLAPRNHGGCGFSRKHVLDGNGH
jgi:hypothetical protein